MLPDGALNIYIAQDYNIEWEKNAKSLILCMHIWKTMKKQYTWIQTHFWKILRKSWKDTYQIHDSLWDWI